jgi:hypothetical protein
MKKILQIVLFACALISVNSFAYPKDYLVPFSQIGYVWANLPTTASYIPSTIYQYNSSGATNTIQRTGVGNYIVKFPNIGGRGNVQVTAYGQGASYCKVNSWVVSGAVLNVSVSCYNAAGAPSDQLYTVLFLSA